MELVLCVNRLMVELALGLAVGGDLILLVDIISVVDLVLEGIVPAEDIELCLGVVLVLELVIDHAIGACLRHVIL